MLLFPEEFVKLPPTLAPLADVAHRVAETAGLPSRGGNQGHLAVIDVIDVIGVGAIVSRCLKQ